MWKKFAKPLLFGALVVTLLAIGQISHIDRSTPVMREACTPRKAFGKRAIDLMG
jgi:hypothetical protein